MNNFSAAAEPRVIRSKDWFHDGEAVEHFGIGWIWNKYNGFF
jgi:hypothetical protein